MLTLVFSFCCCWRRRLRCCCWNLRCGRKFEEEEGEGQEIMINPSCEYGIEKPIAISQWFIKVSQTVSVKLCQEMMRDPPEFGYVEPFTTY